MLTKQFLLNSRLPNHPNFRTIRRTDPPRSMRNTLERHAGGDVDSYINRENTDYFTEDTRKNWLKDIHTESVRKDIEGLGVNKVIGREPPEIDSSEGGLPRKTRTTLTQLRSGYSTFLRQYLHRVGRSNDDRCPKCGTEIHTTEHLFNCAADPTELEVGSLWSDPVGAATFLGLELAARGEPEQEGVG